MKLPHFAAQKKIIKQSGDQNELFACEHTSLRREKKDNVRILLITSMENSELKAEKGLRGISLYVSPPPSSVIERRALDRGIHLQADVLEGSITACRNLWQNLQGKHWQICSFIFQKLMYRPENACSLPQNACSSVKNTLLTEDRFCNYANRITSTSFNFFSKENCISALWSHIP